MAEIAVQKEALSAADVLADPSKKSGEFMAALRRELKALGKKDLCNSFVLVSLGLEKREGEDIRNELAVGKRFLNNKQLARIADWTTAAQVELLSSHIALQKLSRQLRLSATQVEFKIELATAVRDCGNLRQKALEILHTRLREAKQKGAEETKLSEVSMTRPKELAVA